MDTSEAVCDFFRSLFSRWRARISRAIDFLRSLYSHIRAHHAERIQHFYTEHFNHYLNFHRPCAQPEVEVDHKGRTRRTYRRDQTPLETLLSLEQSAQMLSLEAADP